MRIVQQGNSLLVQAPAKLNLSLKILGQRSDGFHELETVMVSLRLHDTLLFEPNNDADNIVLNASIQTDSAGEIPVDQRNLIVRAARLLQATSNTRRGVRIHLTKRIPVAAGMGGGSSDAAATLVALNRMWKLGLTQQDLHQLAAQLGSDLNFFLDSSNAAHCTGRGEQIKEIPLSRQLNFVVVKPDSGLSTAAVFDRWGHTKHDIEEKDGQSRSIETCRALSEFRQQLQNDLQPPATHLNKDIQRSLELLNQHGVTKAAMTGSGSACFGLCRTYREAKRIAAKIRHQKVKGVWATKTGI